MRCIFLYFLACPFFQVLVPPDTGSSSIRIQIHTRIYTVQCTLQYSVVVYKFGYVLVPLSCVHHASGIDESGGASPGWRIENVAAWSRDDLKLKPLRSHLDDMGLQYFYPTVPLRQVVEQFDSRTRLVCIPLAF